MAFGRPIAGLIEGQLARDTAIGDFQFAVLINPALATEQVVNARRNFVPRVQVTGFR